MDGEGSAKDLIKIIIMAGVGLWVFSVTILPLLSWAAGLLLAALGMLKWVVVIFVVLLIVRAFV
jgi:TctA family transporter